MKLMAPTPPSLPSPWQLALWGVGGVLQLCMLVGVAIRAAALGWREMVRYLPDGDGALRQGFRAAPSLLIGAAFYLDGDIEYAPQDENLLLRLRGVSGLSRGAPYPYLSIPFRSMEVRAASRLWPVQAARRVIRVHTTPDDTGPVITCRLPSVMLPPSASYHPASQST